MHPGQGAAAAVSVTGSSLLRTGVTVANVASVNATSGPVGTPTSHVHASMALDTNVGSMAGAAITFSDATVAPAGACWAGADDSVMCERPPTLRRLCGTCRDERHRGGAWRHNSDLRIHHLATAGIGVVVLHVIGRGVVGGGREYEFVSVL